jgi:hypothetical protein
MGLEMVWQDMTTPAIRPTRGDMRSFPFRLLVTDDSISNITPTQTPAINAWHVYSYDLHKATYHGLNHLVGRENKRNFIIGRGCFSGINRFAGLWTGDNSSSWEFLKINVFSQVLALGPSGVAICGQDIGGFTSEEDWQHWADPELLIRWTCAGAFLPWFRNHYAKKDRTKYFQEPYAYQLEQYVGQLNALKQPNPLTLNIYPVNIPADPDETLISKLYEYSMYLDDGVSRSSAPQNIPQYRLSAERRAVANNEYRETHITHTYLDRKTREIKVERTHDNYTPQFETSFFVALLHDPAEPKDGMGPLKSISIQRDADRQTVNPITLGTPEQRADNLKASASDAWYYNEHINISFIKVLDNNKLITITADYV